MRKKAPEPFALPNGVAVAFVFCFGRAVGRIQGFTFRLIWITENMRHLAPKVADSLSYKIGLIVDFQLPEQAGLAVFLTDRTRFQSFNDLIEVALELASNIAAASDFQPAVSKWLRSADFEGMGYADEVDQGFGSRRLKRIRKCLLSYARTRY